MNIVEQQLKCRYLCLELVETEPELKQVNIGLRANIVWLETLWPDGCVLQHQELEQNITVFIKTLKTDSLDNLTYQSHYFITHCGVNLCKLN